MIAVADIEPLRPRIEALVTRVEDQRTRVQTVEAAGRTTFSVSADVLFAFDSARLSARAARPLDAIAERVGERCVEVVGHTDGRGTEAYNAALSRRRAEAVADRLDLRCARVTGRGEADPVAPNDTARGRARNRRVEVRAAR